jgi:hypothetical protein
VLKLGEGLVKTTRHFWPEFTAWLDDIPDSRFFPYVIYDKRFLVWWGISLYLFQLGSRRQLDFDLDTRDTQVLGNLNRLANTKQTTRPVHKTLHHYLGHSRPAAYAWLRSQMVRRLMRMKALDAGRLQGHFVVGVDGTTELVFRQRHCAHCLEFQHEGYTLYTHQVLEAKLLGPANLTLSIASEFIENSDQAAQSRSGDATQSSGDAESRKQDCELAALSRLVPSLRRDFPQVRLCLSGDSLFACGRTLQLAKDHRLAYVLVFKEGHMPAVWADFQSLLRLCPQNALERTTPDGAHQVYRWVHDLSYQDHQGRTWKFTAIQCQETVAAQTTTFAWITDLLVNARTVVDVATKGGRQRWHIENQGFNRQKNSGFNLEHAYCNNPELLKAYYYLLQIAHMILQVFEASNVLRHLAAECGRTPAQLFGSLKNLARRLLDSFRYFVLGDDVFAPAASQRLQIRFDSS